MISFKPLFDFMFDERIAMQDLRKKTGLSSKTTAKFRKGESVSLSTVEKICAAYRIPIEQVVEIKFDEID